MKSSDFLLSLDDEYLEVSKTKDGDVAVCYRGAEIKDGMFLISDKGKGKDFEEACDDYLSKIKGKRLVFNACSNKRREIAILG